MFRYMTPDLRVESVQDLTAARLREIGIEAVLLDIDCTLKRYSETCFGPATIGWLEMLKAEGIGVCLVSNGRGCRVGSLAESHGIPLVCEALKPLPFGCRKAVRQMGFDPARTAMIGDQIFADVMAGRLAGLKTILVRPIQPEEEPWFTQLKRPFEKILLQRWDRTAEKVKRLSENPE